MENILEDYDDIIQKLNLQASFFKHADVIKLVENPFGNVWTTVYQIGESIFNEPAIFSCLANIDLRDELLDETWWLRHPQDFCPRFCETANNTYYENGRSDGYDFIVKEIYFHSLAIKQLHINQEFVL